MKEIGKDFQGWPVNALTLREILIKLGFKEIKEGTFEIIDTSNLLDAYPCLLEDDGMGYGINEEYITEVSCLSYDNNDLGDKTFSVFREKIHKKENE